MIKLKDPFSKDEVLQSLAGVNREVADYFAAIPANAFFTPFPAAWSPAENLVHLIKSVSPVAKALKLPKLLLRVLFGVSKKSSRRFHQLKNDYRRVLAKGGRATGRYIPTVQVATEFEPAQKRILLKWNEVGERLLAGVRAWNEDDLEKMRLPHPLLDKLTAREMLFFTLYHNLHHVNNVRQRLGHELIAL